jgi:murein DD-endopeptidase MepM/ murein hydrolase activator NlpD
MKILACLRGVAIFLFLILVVQGETVLAQGNSPSGPIYIVQEGDSLWEIAQRFGVSLTDLTQINHISNPSLVKPGDQLIIPGLEGVEGILVTRQVSFGESLHSLSRQYGLPVELLARLNRFSSPLELYAGSTLIIPQGSDNSPFGRGTAISPGESLLEYAVANGADPWTLLKANQLAGSWDAMPGDVLRVPGGVSEGPGAFPREVADINVSPLLFTQGKASVVRITAKPLLSIQGQFADRDLHFVQTLNGEYVALQGVHAMLEPGLYPIRIEMVLADGAPFTFTQKVVVLDGGYYNDLPLTVPPETIDPAVTGPEDELWMSLAVPVTQDRYWSEPFLLPIGTLTKEYCLESGQCWTSRFGSRRSYNGSPYRYFHAGLDIAGGIGTEIVAPAPGRVVFAGPLTVRGNATMIDHGWGVYTGYMHQSEILVQVGDFVETGQLIGLVGATGRVEGAHLHWEVLVGGVQVDPLDWLETVYP